MFKLASTLAAAALFAVGTLAQSSTGESGGYYYSFGTDGAGQVDYQNGEGGRYTVSWSGDGNWVGGKGWQTGTSLMGMTIPCLKHSLTLLPFRL